MSVTRHCSFAEQLTICVIGFRFAVCECVIYYCIFPRIKIIFPLVVLLRASIVYKCEITLPELQNGVRLGSAVVERRTCDHEVAGSNLTYCTGEYTGYRSKG